MTYAELKQELVDRGYDYLSTARLGRFVQRSYRTICARQDWPFLQTTKEGTAPLEISDLRKVLSVTDSTNDTVLRGMDRRWLAMTYPDLPDEGNPSYWYLEDDTLKVYPASTSVTLSVRYIKRPAELGESDEPLFPEEYQYLIVDMAATHCLRDNDEYEEARALKLDVDDSVREMAADLLNRNHQNSELVIRTGLSGDYL